ncbi:MAG: hypothetical protein ACFE7R_08320 [Candidatus Hodarchaeota archaeon]
MDLVSEEEPFRQRVGPIVLFGVLSTFFAEGFSGSAPLWFMDAWGLFVVFPLYWTHALLLLNLAMRFRRTSLTQLYLWGVIFGLYESWMTKVIWAGYIGQDPGFGTFLGFAVAEFMVIALFWHTIFSFILPIMVFQVLSFGNQSMNESIQMIPKSGELHISSKGAKSFYIMTLIIGSVFIAAGLVVDLSVTLIAATGNLVLVYLFLVIARRTAGGTFSIESLKLGKRGLGIVSIYLLLLYILLFLILVPERIASGLTIILTGHFYLLVLGLLYLSPPIDAIGKSSLESSLISSRFLKIWFAAFLVLAIAWCILAELTGIIGVFLYLGMILAGPVLFIFAIVEVVQLKLTERKKI